ncbi:hypothetical protein [Roseibium polysiphoniae]|uniref:Yip1 domain-containing protein n=1 Tax=Roseibium polysiphoniae TaxID=2571221 RepID=A0ABR9CFF8_9HYPH|nr:hypothetical protein [Roseibium polysiphoniae]MBD8878299.1 hypothetical protein [Roseibium polysiphoniae]
MLSGQEIARALQGSWMLLRNRPEGMRGFDLSIEGFWRSFAVVFLLVPLFVVSSLAERKLLLDETDFLPAGAFWLAQFTSLGLDWVALPLLLAGLAKPLGISAGYVPFIVARNWTSLLAALPYVFVGLLYLAGLIAPGIMVLLSLVTLIVVIWYRFIIARVALQASMSMTIGVVILDIILSLLIGELAGRIWGL